MTDIYSTLKKIKAVADGTNFECERESAFNKLRDLMERHGISEQELSDDALTICEFKYKGKREYLLLQQIFFKVLDTHNLKIYKYHKGGQKVRSTVGVDCTAAQSIEIRFLFDFYRDLYHREEQSFYIAFINKHKLFGSPDGTEGEKLSNEELKKLHQMMEGMDSAMPYKQIEERSERDVYRNKVF
jgi:hypothetical protein